jgi:autotransporter-associated beta strand protein
VTAAKRATAHWVLPALAALLFAPLSALSATFTWDVGGGFGNAATDGGGTWSLAGSNWYGAAGDSTWADGSDAVFGNGGAGGTVALAGSFSANSLTFQPVTSPYTLSDDGNARTLTIAGGGITVEAGAGAVAIGTSNLGILLGASQTWTSGGPSLWINGSVGSSATSGTQTLTFAGTGATYVSGAIGNGSAGGTVALTVAGAGAGTVSLSAGNTYSGSTEINSGTLLLDFSAPGAPASNIVNYSANSSGLGFQGGTLAIRGAPSGSGNTQQFNGLTLWGGSGTIQLNQNGNSTPPVLNLGPIYVAYTTGFTPVLGATLLLDTSLGGVISTAAHKDSTGIYGARIVYYDGTDYDWATSTSTTAPYRLSRAATTTPLPSSGAASATNYFLSGGGALAASETANTLKIEPTAPGGTLAIGSGQTLTLAGGGLLFAGSNDYTISGGLITAGSGTGNYELIVQQYAASDNLTIAAVVVDPPGGTASLTKAGPGTLTLAATNTYTGTTTVVAGTLALTGANPHSGAVTVLGGTLALTGSASTGGVTVDNTGGNATLSLGATGMLATNTSEYVGNGGTGSFLQLGGTNSVFYNLYLGYRSGSKGTYSLNSPGVLTANCEYIGDSGAGNFIQSGGTNMINALNGEPTSYVGYAGSGTYTLSGGSLGIGYGGNLCVGGFYNCPASFTQSGGTNNISGTLNVPAGGSYLLSGGQLTAQSESLAAFTQTGGSNTVGANGGTLTLNGPYVLTGGTLNVLWTIKGSAPLVIDGNSCSWSLSYSPFPQLVFASSPTINVSYALGASTPLSGATYVGQSGTASLAQSAGTQSPAAMYFGYNPGASGNYLLSGGTLQPGNVYLGYSGTGNFTQTGGNNVLTLAGNCGLYLGYNPGGNGIYTLSAGSLSSYFNNGGLYVGCLGVGSFTQTGGTNALGTLCLGQSAGGSGTYSLSAGHVNAFMETIASPLYPSSTGAFTQTGGSNAAHYLNIESGGTYTLSAGTLTVTGAIGGPGPLVVNGGSWSAASGISAPLVLASSPGVNLTCSLGVSSQLGSTTYVGQYGAASLTQSGGTQTAGVVYFGYNPGATGSYSLSGGSLAIASSAYLGYGGTGSFTQSGGTATFGGLTLGNSAASSGSYDLDGGKFIASAITGGSGTAAFNFSGGTLQAAGPLPISLPIDLATSGRHGTIDTGGYAVAVAGQLFGPGGLVKVGTGTLTLAATNTYSGTTTVSAGVLAAGTGGALSPNSDVTVSGGTLDASGYANTVNSLTVASGGELDLGIGNLLTSSGPASLGGALSISGTVSGPLVELLAYGSETGSFATVNGVPAGYALQYNSTQLDLTATPEPSTLVLLGVAAAGLMACRWRRRAKDE